MHPNWKPKFSNWITTEYEDKLIILTGDFNTVLSREDCRNPFRINNYYGTIKDIDSWNTYFQKEYHIENTEWLNQIIQNRYGSDHNPISIQIN